VQHDVRQFRGCGGSAGEFTFLKILLPGSGERMIIGCRDGRSRKHKQSQCEAFHGWMFVSLFQ
jgi:hypothetical protein